MSCQVQLESGDVIKLQSKSNSKYLRILDTMNADCNGDEGTACELHNYYSIVTEHVLILYHTSNYLLSYSYRFLYCDQTRWQEYY